VIQGKNLDTLCQQWYKIHSATGDFMRNSKLLLDKNIVFRTINLPELPHKKSHFLIGPRSTGKSTAIGEQLSNKAVIVNLLRSPVQSTLVEISQAQGRCHRKILFL
jgi:hypothetical protein